MLTGCLSAELSDVVLSNCPENFGQIQKIIFFHLFQSDGTRNLFEPNLAMDDTDPAVLANWTSLLAATDETKPIPSPIIAEPVSEPGAVRTYGGGNATPGGVTLNIGREPQNFECKLLSQGQLDTIKALKTFQKGSGYGKSTIGVVFVNEAGELAFDTNGAAVDAVGLKLYPFPVHSLFISDKALGGLEGIDFNMMSFQLPADWSDNFHIVTPSDFNGLDLVNS